MIKILDAIAGAGKTHAIIASAIEAARSGQRVNISLPTRAVIDEKHGEAVQLANGAFPVLKVYSSTDGDEPSVGDRLEETLTELSPRKGAVLFTTHKTFNECPNWIGRHGWRFFIDEVFDPITEIRLRVPRTHVALTRHVELVTSDAPFSEVRIAHGGRAQLKLMLDGSDEGEAPFRKLASHLLNADRWTVYVKTEQFNAVTSGIGLSKSRDERERAAELVFWIEARPWFEKEGLNVTLSSACLTDRLLYKRWRDTGTVFKSDNDLAAALRATRHDGHGLRLHCMNIDSWSAYARRGGARYGANLAGVETPERALEQLIASQFAGQRFIYSANDAWENDRLFDPNGQRVKVVMHGRNDFSDYRHVAFMPSLLPVPDKFDLIRWLGHSADDIRDEYYHSHAYQTVFRTAARSPNREGEVNAIVPGRLACQYIQSKAPGADIIQHEVLPPRRARGRPPTYSTPDERKRARATLTWQKRNPGRPITDYAPRGQAGSASKSGAISA